MEISSLLTIVFVALMAILIAYPIIVASIRTWERRLERRAGDRLARHRAAMAEANEPLFAAAGRAWSAERAEAEAEPTVTIAPQPQAGAVAEAGAERRRHLRKPVYVLGRLFGAAREEDCDIIDLSSGGARIRSADPAPTTLSAGGVTLHLNETDHLPAKVVWRRGDQLGLHFAEPASAARAVAPYFASRKVA